jgi:hypothetical protein
MSCVGNAGAGFQKRQGMVDELEEVSAAMSGLSHFILYFKKIKRYKIS